MTALALVEQTATNELTPAQAAQQFANYLKKQNYCIDVSSFPMKPIQYGVDKPELIENLKYKYINWAKLRHIRVKNENYTQFLDGLVDRLVAMLPRVHGKGFNPNAGAIYKNHNGVQLANTFIPFKPEFTSPFVMPEILQEYFDRVIPDAFERKIVLQFLAHIIQRPWERPMWFIVLQGEQGVGKSLLYDMVSMALGNNHHWDDNSYAPLSEKFGDVLTTNLIAHFDDAPVQDKTYTNIKHTITRKNKTSQAKYVQGGIKHPVYARIMVSFNIDERPFMHAPGCRRTFYVAPCMHKNKSPEESADFFAKFHKEFLNKPDAALILNQMFWSIDISDFDIGSCPRTDTYERMTSNGSTVLEDSLQKYTKDGSIFHINTLYGFLRTEGIPFPERELDKIKQGLVRLNYESSARPVPKCGKNVTVWQPKAKRSRKIYDDEITEIQRAMSISF